MEISGAALIFVFGCLGGAAIELLRWWKLREGLELPAYARKPAYWFLTIAMIIVGGLIAMAYGTGKTNAILAMNLGASAPAIIGALATKPKGAGTGDEQSFGGSPPTLERLRSFLAFGR
jgi:hypothetical protein